jgi:hypothetical protein
MNTNTRSIAKTIDQNYNRFMADPDHKSGLKALDHKSLAAATEGLNEKIATVLNYYVLLRSMRSLKLIKGTLSDTAEKTLVVRGQETVGVFRDISSRIGEIGKALGASGLDKVVDRHIESLCQHLPDNPKVLPLLQTIKGMGITEAEISCVSEELSKNNYNLLKYHGSDGTLAGFVRMAESLNEPLQAEQKLMEQFGLPTVQGAGSGTPAGAVVFIVVVVVVALFLCIWFYA